jgi:predicted metalloprotease
MIGGGLGTIIIVLAIYFLGGDPSQVLDTMQVNQSQTESSYSETSEENEMAQFVSVVLAETEDVWTELFNRHGLTYEYPKLVLFSDAVQSACGYAGSSTGPFYCSVDHKVYIDLSFFQELQNRFQAPGDFATAYVVAHEIGHHVQTLLGTMDKMTALRLRLSERGYNKYLIRFELQADYLAGVWAYYAARENILEEGDIEEALNTVSAVGDDRIQKTARGYVVPDSFTHGTSEQRMRWFHKGLKSGNLEDGDTFSDDSL